ncbi:MAG TPA: nucleotidyl transferase AbiEii/AbiGii toxin family protein [Chthoniobacterales bacterium]|jgi:hypothetical protein|nr:nucleotidyl transferase AbiEii/AbiGii toxin family protein [Chthoniobacterales bacterium]
MHTASLEHIISSLDAAEVRYLIAGGVAVNGHGYLRFTKDLDLYIQLVPENLLRALRALEQIGFRPNLPLTLEEIADPSLREQWHRDKNMIVVQMWSDLHPRTPIDIFISEPFDFNSAYSAAPRIEMIPGVHARLVPLDQLIGMKLESGRPQDLIDVDHLRTLRELNDE